jgi:tetratricopeptide (TPR) repeat protein
MLSIQRRILGSDHPETLVSMGNLATVIADQGRYADAEKLYRQTLQIDRRILGPSDSETLRTMDNLADSVSKQGRYAEAEKLERETVNLHKRFTGPEASLTASAVYNLACILTHEGRHEEALSLLRQAVEHGLLPKTLLNMTNDPDLKPLHGDPRFEELVATAKRNVSTAQQLH